MKSLLTTAALSVFALSMLATPTQNVQAGCLKDKNCCEKSCCPKCSHRCQTCNLEAELVDVEKKCFEVEVKTICIPKVVFPWQKKQSSCHACDSCDGRGCTNCVHNGAKVRKIKVLKSKKYKCPECKYTWTPGESSSCCGTKSSCGAGCCDSDCGCDEASCEGGCDNAGFDSGMILEIPEPVGTYGMSYQQFQGDDALNQDAQGTSSFSPIVIEPPRQ